MQTVIPAEARPLLSAATAELVFANSMLTNAIFADRRTAACVCYSTWTNPILSRTLRQQKMRLSDEERNACLDCSKKEKAPRTPPSQGRILSSPPPESHRLHLHTRESGESPRTQKSRLRKEATSLFLWRLTGRLR